MGGHHNAGQKSKVYPHAEEIHEKCKVGEVEAVARGVSLVPVYSLAALPQPTTELGTETGQLVMH